MAAIIMDLPARLRCGHIFLLLPILLAANLAFAQSRAGTAAQAGNAPRNAPEKATWTNKFDLGAFAEYSPTSSHILLGYARQRVLAGVGGSFDWRLLNRNSVALFYLAEVRPLLMESDPTLASIDSNQYGNLTFTPPAPVTDPGNPSVYYNSAFLNFQQGYSDARFSRRWTYSGGVSPIGLKLNGFTDHRLQPEATGNLGFLVASRDVPVNDSSAFNFTFQVGVGVQWYRTQSQSIQVELRYHHLSNHNLGTQNPGVDSALWKVTYSFGRNRLVDR